MKFAAFLLIVGLMVVNGCLAAVPLDEPKKLLSAPETDVLEPELVLAEPLNPALLAQGVAGRRVVRQTYDDVSVDVVNSNGGGGGDYGGGYGGDYGNGGETEVDVDVSSY